MSLQPVTPFVNTLFAKQDYTLLGINAPFPRSIATDLI